MQPKEGSKETYYWRKPEKWDDCIMYDKWLVLETIYAVWGHVKSATKQTQHWICWYVIYVTSHIICLAVIPFLKKCRLVSGGSVILVWERNWRSQTQVLCFAITHFDYYTFWLPSIVFCLVGLIKIYTNKTKTRI